MFEEVIEFNGEKPGNTSIILGGVHGDETCGVTAIKKVMSSLTIEKGRVIFAYGNPRAIEEGRRFTEANLNRMFKQDSQLSKQEKHSYEYFRAQFLKTYLNQADALLDIHASFTPESRPFVICEKNAKEIVSQLPIELIVTGFDNVEPGGTDYFMNTNGKVGICVECGFLGDPESVRVAQDSILSFLSTQGHIDRELETVTQTYISMFELYTTKSDSFVLSKQFNDFEEITAKQLIGRDGNHDVRSKDNCVILFARNQKTEGEEAFLLGRTCSVGRAYGAAQ